jgi:hypothetical protein
MTKVASLVLAAAVVVSASGCGQKTAVSTPDGKKLEMSVPGGKASIRQGEKAGVKVAVKRTGFEDPLEVKFLGMPEKVAVVGGLRVEKGSGTQEATFIFQADPQAPPVRGHVVRIEASGGGMKTNQVELTIDVLENKK